MKYFRLFQAIILALLIALSPLSGAYDYKNSGSTPVKIDFKDLEINDFIKLVSKILNKNVLLSYDIPGKVEFISNAPIYKENILEILLSTLDSKGYTLVDSGTYFEVVKSNEATNYNLPIVRSAKHDYKQMVSETITVRGDTAESVAAKIKHLNSKYGKIITVKESNKLLVTDFPKNIESIKETIRVIENQYKKSMKVVELYNTKVENVIENIMKISRGLLDSRIESEAYELIPNKENNSIVMIGTEKSLEVLDEIIAQVDVKKEETEIVSDNTIKIVNLHNSDAEEVAKVVQSVISGRQYKDPTEKPNISADKELNAIVVIGSKSSVYEIERLIGELDVEKQQVYIKAQIIEISQKRTKDLGIKYGLEAGTATSNGLFTLGTNLGGSAIASTLANSFLNFDTSALKSAFALGASLNFLKVNNAADIVSEPTILCLDNKESSIFVGEVTSITTSTTSGTSATDLARNSFSRESVGLSLKVKPRISQDGKVMIEAHTKLEDFSGSVSASGQPDTTNREVQTVAIVKNGESVIIGGLIKNKETDASQNVPLLSDVPVLGNLFKYNNDYKDKTNLVIILTPYIVEKSSNLTTLMEKLTELNKLQKQYNDRVLSELNEKRKKL